MSDVAQGRPMRARAKVDYNEDRHERDFKAAIKVILSSTTQKGKGTAAPDAERRSARNTGKENQKRYRWGWGQVCVVCSGLHFVSRILGRGI